MSGFKTLAALAAALVLAPAALAQQGAQVALMDGDASAAYRAAGVVTAEAPATSNTLPKQQLDQELRAQASKLGADAVIHVTYQMTGTAHTASGVAIRYTQPAAPAAPPAAPPVATLPPAPLPSPQQPAPAAPVPAAPVAAALPAVTHAASAAQVELTEGAMNGRRYVRLGPVSAVSHQTSLFPKVSPRQQLEEALRAEAFKQGADAVIEVKYEMVNALTSRKGHRAGGVAVRFE